jgi:microsomal epoxide hydrolase
MAVFKGSLQVKPFKVHIPDSDLDELKQLLRLSKIGPSTFENTKQSVPSYGLSRAWTENSKAHWLNQYDWYALKTAPSLHIF